MMFPRTGAVLLCLAAAGSVGAGLIGVGLDWRKNIFVQEYWKDGKAFYAIANKGDEDQTIVCSSFTAGRGQAEPWKATWKVKAHSVIQWEASMLVGTDLLKFDVEGGESLGLLTAPVAPAEAPTSAIVTCDGLNGSGGRHPDVWAEQDAPAFSSGSVVELRLRIPGSKGPLVVRNGDLEGVEVSCKTLQAEPGKDAVTLDVSKPVTAQDAHVVVLKFKAPNVEKATVVVVDTWLWETGKKGGHGVTRGVVIEPAAPRK